MFHLSWIRRHLVIIFNIKSLEWWWGLYKTLIIKIGGSILKDKNSIRNIVEPIKDLIQKGQKIVIVVSALKGATDSLLDNSAEMYDEAPPWMLSDLVSMGERSSARLLAAALAASDLNPIVVDPANENWPIITDEDYFNANPILEITGKLIEKEFNTLLEKGLLPVVCGFIGKSKEGKVTLLGRGGSDTTAVLLGRYIKESEVILVKDTGSFLSGDPTASSSTSPLENLSVDDAYALSTGGAKVIQPKALQYKTKDTVLRIAS